MVNSHQITKPNYGTAKALFVKTSKPATLHFHLSFKINSTKISN